MRTPLIAANWKMNTNIPEAVHLVTQMLASLNDIKGTEIAICPPFVSLNSIKEIIKNTGIKLGSQNMYFEVKGAYTGEISPYMLRDLCDFVILGHSERRQYFFETDEIINKKIVKAIETGISPIFCVGEKLEENESGKTESVITNQLTIGLSGIKPYENMVIAYEPIWAIGTGKAASGLQANEVIKLIRNTVRDIWNKRYADGIRILYGGSVSASNITEFISEPEIDGALVGGASLKADDFIKIVSRTSEIKAAK